ncbi:MAG: universal stress protein [Proteobacteria bacterium]|nr:universal stress protein [Pseudomonadota bacterium]
MAFRRRAYEPGHRAKILTIIDGTPECERAVLFAARRARRSGANVVMLAIIVPEPGQPWLGIGEMMQAEAEAEAEARFLRMAEIVRREAGFEPERSIRTGPPAEEVAAAIEADEDIAGLVLAAGTGKEGPGPLIAHIAGRIAANFPVPVTIVPGGLSEADFGALA